MSDVEQWEHDEQLAMENEIISLREQVEKLTKERDIKEHCITQFELEDLRMKDQLAALAEQNEKMREALVDCEQALDECRDYPITYDSVIEALSLPNLASPVLNRIRADGMKEAFLLYSPDDTAQDWVDKILARADELEASSHD